MSCVASLCAPTSSSARVGFVSDAHGGCCGPARLQTAARRCPRGTSRASLGAPRVEAAEGSVVRDFLGENVGVVIVDHGSRRQASNELLVSAALGANITAPTSVLSCHLQTRSAHAPHATLLSQKSEQSLVTLSRPNPSLAQEEFVVRYREATGRTNVEAAHMELADPSIEEAFGRCVAAGATAVAVSPFFLSPGRHWQEDIPKLVKEAADKHPGVGYFVAAPLGLHPLMNDIIDSRQGDTPRV